MDLGNETTSPVCTFLSEDYFGRLHKAFVEAFSDYVIPFALSEEQFRNHINLNAVDLNRSIACLEGDRVIGFTLNGFGEWNGKSTAYDAGTGVVPGRRRRGLSNAMFEVLLPQFEEQGIEQVLLEVVTTNTPAIRLYEKLSFGIARELALLECSDQQFDTSKPPLDLVVREIETPDWKHLTSFWDAAPSWQNSVRAVARSRKTKRLVGAFAGGVCVGYICFSAKLRRVAQIAVDQNYRNRGVGMRLLRELQAGETDGSPMQVINIDKAESGAMSFFHRCGFRERLSQHEMLKTLNPTASIR